MVINHKDSKATTSFFFFFLFVNDFLGLYLEQYLPNLSCHTRFDWHKFLSQVWIYYAWEGDLAVCFVVVIVVAEVVARYE